MFFEVLILIPSTLRIFKEVSCLLVRDDNGISINKNKQIACQGGFVYCKVLIISTFLLTLDQQADR